jgi:hypothetical protein
MKEQTAELPAASVAFQVTLVLPLGKAEPLGKPLVFVRV